jgi:hypothetical protein
VNKRLFAYSDSQKLDLESSRARPGLVEIRVAAVAAHGEDKAVVAPYPYICRPWRRRRPASQLELGSVPRLHVLGRSREQAVHPQLCLLRRFETPRLLVLLTLADEGRAGVCEARFRERLELRRLVHMPRHRRRLDEWKHDRPRNEDRDREADNRGHRCETALPGHSTPHGMPHPADFSLDSVSEERVGTRVVAGAFR